MGPTRAKFEPWLNDYLRPRYPELEQLIVAALDAFDAIQATGNVTPELLSPIVEAASSSRGPLYENASGLLGKLLGEFEGARKAVMLMSIHSQSSVRFNAILCIGESTPRPFSLTILRNGLQDKSSRIRAKAADWICTMRIRELVPELERAFAQEGNKTAKKTIEFALKLLRDGYILRPGTDGRFWVTTLRCNGGTIGRSLPRSELDDRGIEAIVAELSNDSR